MAWTVALGPNGRYQLSNGRAYSLELTLEEIGQLKAAYDQQKKANRRRAALLDALANAYSSPVYGLHLLGEAFATKDHREAEKQLDEIRAALP